MAKKKYKLSAIRLFWMGSALACAFLGLVLWFVFLRLGSSQDSQMMAERWSERKNVAQISAFFSSYAQADKETVQQFRYSLNQALLEASISVDADHPDARLWVDAYSTEDEVTLIMGKGKVNAKAIAIGGDFFLFHPLKLKSGAYFSGNDLNQDYCILDEDTAWQLFGSYDVVGMMVEVEGKLLVVSGVVEKPKGRLAESAGVSGLQVYVSYDFLNGLNPEEELPISNYELIMPNPVSTFAMQKVKESMPIEEEDVEILQNTQRYAFVSCVKLLPAYGTRSMNGKAIIYPYWENMARGYEDILMLVVLVMLLLFLYTIFVIVVEFCIWWKNKGWTFGSVFAILKDKLERFGEKRYAKRQAKKNNIDRNLDLMSEEEM